jgi:hypothetical protein
MEHHKPLGLLAIGALGLLSRRRPRGHAASTEIGVASILFTELESTRVGSSTKVDIAIIISNIPWTVGDLAN